MANENQPLTPQQTIRALMMLIREMREKFGTKLKIKQKSPLMRLIGAIMFFNEGFMNDFITVIGKTIYFPKNWEGIIKDCEHHLDSGADDSDFPITSIPEARNLFGILCHEYVHQKDFKSNKLFPVLYLYPAIFAVPGLIGLIMSFWDINCIFLVAFLLYGLPTPAYWRSLYEARGYATNLVLRSLLYGNEQDRDHNLSHLYMKYFTGPSYYWMSGHPFFNKLIGKMTGGAYVNGVHKMVEKRFDDAAATIESRECGKLDELEHVYRIVNKVQKG